MEEQEDDIVLEEEGEALQDTLKKLRERLKVATTEKQEYLEGWQRMRADFANEKRASEVLRANITDSVMGDAAEKIIPVVDALDMAMQSADFQNAGKNWQQGIESLRAEVLRALKDLGVEPFSPKGEEFDPNTMNAIREVDGTPNRVEIIDRQGYKMGERIIRPAYVAIGKESS